MLPPTSSRHSAGHPTQSMAAPCRCLSLDDAFVVECLDRRRRKAQFFEYLLRMLTEQWGGATWHDGSMAEAYIVPRYAHLPHDGMLPCADHIVSGGVRVVEKDLTLAIHDRCTRNASGAQALEALL